MEVYQMKLHTISSTVVKEGKTNTVIWILQFRCILQICGLSMQITHQIIE